MYLNCPILAQKCLSFSISGVTVSPAAWRTAFFIRTFDKEPEMLKNQIAQNISYLLVSEIQNTCLQSKSRVHNDPSWSSVLLVPPHDPLYTSFEILAITGNKTFLQINVNSGYLYFTPHETIVKQEIVQLKTLPIVIISLRHPLNNPNAL